MTHFGYIFGKNPTKKPHEMKRDKNKKINGQPAIWQVELWPKFLRFILFIIRMQQVLIFFFLVSTMLDFFLSDERSSVSFETGAEMNELVWVA